MKNLGPNLTPSAEVGSSWSMGGRSYETPLLCRFRLFPLSLTGLQTEPLNRF
jgi:hypothetical protein